MFTERQKQDGRLTPWREDHGRRPVPEGPVIKLTQPRQPWRPSLWMPFLVVFTYFLWDARRKNEEAYGGKLSEEGFWIWGGKVQYLTIDVCYLRTNINQTGWRHYAILIVIRVAWHNLACCFHKMLFFILDVEINMIMQDTKSRRRCKWFYNTKAYFTSCILYDQICGLDGANLLMESPVTNIMVVTFENDLHN